MRPVAIRMRSSRWGLLTRCIQRSYSRQSKPLRNATAESSTGKPETRDPVVLKSVSRNAAAANHSSESTKKADETLIKDIFDSEEVWSNFSGNRPGFSLKLLKKTRTSYSDGSTGLFGNPYLVSPEGLLQFCNDSLRKAQAMVERLTQDLSPEGLHNFVKLLDQLSDILCRVIDLAEFIRLSHPDQEFVAAAQECHERMFNYMNVLNTNTDLYYILDSVMQNPDIRASLTPEEQAVGQILLGDFVKSGVHMQPEDHERFVQLSSDISLLGQQFHNMLGTPRNKSFAIPSNQLSDMNLSSLGGFGFGKKIRISTHSPATQYILHDAKSEAARRKVWLEIHDVPDVQLDNLSQMLTARLDLARMMGKSSYAEYQLSDKMAKTPVNVTNFLNELATTVKPDALKEVQLLADLKTKLTGGQPVPPEEVSKFIKPWDRDYLTSRYSHSKRSRSTQGISAFFSLGSVMQGLSMLFDRIYGLRLVPAVTKPGEVWNEDVRKLEVISEDQGKVGIIYCDLFYRARKTQNPAHFTVCCSRKIYPLELEESAAARSSLTDNFDNLDTIETSVSESGEVYQLPVISLVCNFSKDPRIGNKSLLSLAEVETLFHEMGHAMHSMLGRTDLHNVSGTRCVTDFVELPSVLMEHFANNYQVLSLFARHHQTGQALPEELLKDYQLEDTNLRNCETYGQIKMALLDQMFHSEMVSEPDFSLENVYHNLEAKYEIFADTESRWFGQFGHLFGYGASYYSYLFDKAIAKKVWHEVFTSDPLSREAGEKFRNEVLKWGGARDPWECIARVTGEPELASGDSLAMEAIAMSR